MSNATKLNKVQLRVELNKACSDILNVALLLDLPTVYENVRDIREFMSRRIDDSNYPE